MASLQVRWPELSATKQRALDDAKKMQKAIVEGCIKAGKEVPKYHLSELIGKGSFGRVYKAKSQTTGQLVAIKIIDIEESDTLNPKLSDTYSDLLKEINALQLLSDSGAKNINHVIEALPVGHSMWMITEYCAGGSVATLMKPTAPGGLQEKWIIPILREVAEALRWVHGQGIIHRDIKCANVLVTEIGNVQLCDFGVAGVIETKFDKRTTCVGTLHWMAPELFDLSASYGREVDIWAFGAMVYEIASGLPPNVADGVDFSRLGVHLKQQTPRLEGDRYSSDLKDLVAYCLQQDSAKRPSIELIQRHGYIYQTESAHPTSSLAHLVRGFKIWEAQGGDRRSLFSAGGAQGISDASQAIVANDDWNFSTTAAFDQQVFDNADEQDVYDVYGSQVDLSQPLYEETTRPVKPKSRRRPPHLPSVKAPLEKVFDPHTMSNYEDNSRAYYGKPLQPPVSDLPLRDEFATTVDVRESLIDLDASLHGSDLSHFVDVDTVRFGDPGTSVENRLDDTSFHAKTPLSDPADVKDNRRTQDWKFPTMPPPASANPELFRPPFGDESPNYEQGRPPLFHHVTEPYPTSSTFGNMPSTSTSPITRASVGSLIDLDMSLPNSVGDFARPSTAHSDVGSVSSEVGVVNPFELERHASLHAMPNTNSEPSIYVSDDFYSARFLSDQMQPHSSDSESTQRQSQVNGRPSNISRPYSLSEFADMDPESMSPPPSSVLKTSDFPSSFQDPPSPGQQKQEDSSSSNYADLPALPLGPSPRVMEGRAFAEEVKNELQRMAMSLGDHLSFANTYLSNLPIRRSIQRIEVVGSGN